MVATARFHTAPTKGAKHRTKAIGAVADSVGFPLLPWAKKALRVASEYNPGDDTPRRRRVTITVPRQSGKSVLVACLAIEALMRDRQYAIYMAQSRSAGRARLLSMASMLKASGLDSGARVTLGTGNERIQFSNGSVIEVQSPTSTAVHGESVSLAIVDEAFAIEAHVMAAISPSMAARPRAQLWVISTAGTLADSHMFNDLCDRGRAEPDGGMVYIEYSMDRDTTHPFEWDAYWNFHPGLGQTITLETLKDEADALPIGQFLRAYGNIPTASEDAWLPGNTWADSALEVATIPAGELVVGVEITRWAASISAAWPTADGSYHCDLVEYRAGTDSTWVKPKLDELASLGPLAVVWDKTGPTGLLHPELSDFCESRAIEPLARTRTERSRGDMFLYRLILDGGFSHNSLEPLDAAADGAITVAAGDLWRFSRSKAVVDPGPLISASLATYAAHEMHVLAPKPLLVWS